MNTKWKWINIAGIPKWKVLKALWESSHEQGLSFMGVPTQPVTDETFINIINDRVGKEYHDAMYFDYVMGRVIKCDLIDDVFDPHLYDRECGAGAAEAAIKSLMKSEMNSMIIDTINTYVGDRK